MDNTTQRKYVNTDNNSPQQDTSIENNGNTQSKNVNVNNITSYKISNNESNDSVFGKEVRQEQTMSLLPSYPLLDTFSLLCILMIFPHWISAIFLILYVFLGHPDFWDTLLAFALKHKLNKSKVTVGQIQKAKTRKFSIFSFILYLVLDAFFMSVIFYFSPAIVPYIIILSKSFIASNMTSLRNRYILDAFISSILLIVLERSALYSIKHFEIFRGDSIFFLSSNFASTDFLYPLYYNNPTTVTKTLLFHLSFHKVHYNSILMYQLEYALKFLHSTLSLYTIMHNLSPILRKIALLNNIYEKLESFAFSDLTEKSASNNNHLIEKNMMLQNNITISKYRNTFHIPHEISSSTLPILSFLPNLEEDDDAENIDYNTNIQNNIGKFPTDHNRSVEEKKPNNEFPQNQETSETNNGTTKNLEDDVPMWFPDCQKVTNIKDISSTSYVVSQNFENLCKMIWSSTSNLISASKDQYLLDSPIISQNLNVYSSSSSPPFSSSGSRRHIVGNSPKKVIPKLKYASTSDKKGKLNLLKYQQPLWTFLNATRTMFLRQDHYSGDYASENAIVPIDNGVNDYSRHNNSSPHCFMWYTGEKTIAFELRSISLEHLLIKVNGIIWEHVRSCNYKGNELLIIEGLTPLHQYDIDFVRIKLNGELSLLTSCTISTIYQDKTFTNGNKKTPITTLQDSIATTRESVERDKAIIKKLKSDWKKKSVQIKSEIMSLNNRSNVSDESRNYKKLDSLRTTVTKLDTEITNLSKKLDKVRLLLTETEENHYRLKRFYENESRGFNKIVDENNKAIKELNHKISSLNADKSQLLVKKEKCISKKLKIQHDVEVLIGELESLKDTEISLRIEKRKIRSNQREEKYKLLVKEFKNYEQQLKSQNVSMYQ